MPKPSNPAQSRPSRPYPESQTCIQAEPEIIRFASPEASSPLAARYWIRLLPPRWQRRAVIGGQCYWLPR